MRFPDAILSRLAAIPALAMILVSAPAFALTIADMPLFLTSAVKPNIMLMLDDSGSMSNIVPDTPYDPKVTYLATCPAANVLPGGAARPGFPANSETFDVKVSAGGTVTIVKSGTGAGTYAYGTDTTATSPKQECFDPALRYNARLNADYSIAYLDAVYSGNYLNWYLGASPAYTTAASFTAGTLRKAGTVSRLEIAKTAAKGLVDSLSTNVRVGFSSYNGSTGGWLLELMGDVDTAKRTSTKTKIDSLTATNSTPLAETLSDIGGYFAEGYTGNLTLHPGTAGAFTKTVDQVFNSHTIRYDSGSKGSPIQYSCQKSFAVLLTDGRPQADRAISNWIYDYTGDCAAGLCIATPTASNLPGGPLPDKSSQNGTKVGRSYEQQGSDYLDDVAAALHDMDLRPDLAKTGTQKNNLVTYMVGFADEEVLNPDASGVVHPDPLIQDTATRGGGEFLTAANSGELADVFNATLSDIMGKVSSAAAVATNSTRLNTDTLVYQALFNSGDWSGQLVAYTLNSDGTLGAAKWDTDTAGVIPAPAARNIFTWNGSAQVLFTAANFGSLSAAQQTALQTPTCLTDATACANARIDWLRGDQSKEADKVGGIFRQRSKPLGDVVNSDPLFVSGENYGYVKFANTTAEGGGDFYIAYLTAKKSRKAMLYVGANDGMLHALDADTGTEQFAYIPNGVFSKLSSLTNPAYSHTYFVDGTSYAADAYINTGDGLRWHTILVGSLGAGGRSVFALDITDPAAADFGKPLWEFTDADLGFNVGAAQIVKLISGQWAAIFGNGYNSDNNLAKLFMVNLATGTLIAKVDTGVGSAGTPNGLGAPAVYDGNDNRLVGDYSGSVPTDAIYAGDLLGNVWKFGNSASGWTVTYAAPLFSAKDSGAKAQPITAPLEIGEPPPGTGGGVMVFIGTGSYFTTADTASKDVQSLYGIWDNGTKISSTDRSALQQQTIDFELTAFGEQLRVVSSNTVDYSTKRGWYMDLLPPSGTAQGERVASTPLLRHGRVIFTTLIPSTDVCSFGGSGWLMELTAATGGRLDYSVFDLYGSGDLFNEEDYVTVTIGGKDVKVPASGIRSKVGITKAPAVISAGGVEHKVQSGTDTSGANKGVQVTKEKGAGGKPRTSWRQLFSEDK